MSWRRITAMYRKDLRDARRDTRLLMALLIPLLLGVLYGLMFDDESKPTATLGYVASAESTLPQALEEAASEALIVDLRRVADEVELRRLVRDEDVDVGVLIPAAFDAELAAGEAPGVTVILPASPSFGGDYLAALVEPVAQDLAGQKPAVVVARAQLDARSDTAAALEALGQRRVFILISLILMLVMIAAYALPTTITEENEKKTLEALALIAPHWEIIAAKALFGLTYCVVSLPLLLLVTREQPAGWLVFAAGMGASAVALVGLGLLFGVVVKTQSQLNNWSSLLMFPLLVPAFIVGLPTPAWVNAIVFVLPTVQTMRLGVNGLAGRAVFDDMWLSFLVLAAWAVVAYGLIAWRLNRREAA